MSHVSYAVRKMVISPPPPSLNTFLVLFAAPPLDVQGQMVAERKENEMGSTRSTRSGNRSVNTVRITLQG